jgi:outer membrane protein W
MFTKAEGAAGTSTTTTAVPNQSSLAEQIGSQLPSIDSVLLNLSTKKTNGKPQATSTAMHGAPPLHPSTVALQHNAQAYGLQVNDVYFFLDFF